MTERAVMVMPVMVMMPERSMMMVAVMMVMPERTKMMVVMVMMARMAIPRGEAIAHRAAAHFP